MGVTKLIFDEKDLTTYSDEMLKRIDKAVLAAAFRIRDNMRSAFISSASMYKHSTPKYNKLAEGIVVGKLNDSKVKIHALGTREYYDSYKTRFFVGGTSPRTQSTKKGKQIKPHSKGYISANNAVDTGINGAENILNSFIKTTIEN